jgi:murein DD-endopeptidase MepM/ murein hydrolase activator NlpD
MPLKGSLTSLFIFLITYLYGQTYPYPQNYFRNPLGIPMELTANFGEIRNDHWHMGLDIRTNQKENQPVYAAAAGFISHIGIRPQSFGRYIIIDHPNGLSTLYAHLNDFFPVLEKYVTDQQYKQESWAIEMDLDKKAFPVSKGQFIAYSGNTGGSQGPHLHFEIRDTKTQKCLNPLLFGLPVEDNVPPTLIKLALYNRSRSAYDQSPQLYNLKNTDSGYIIPKMEVLKTGYNKPGFGIQTYDRVTGSSNPNGIYKGELFFDEQPVSGFVLDSISYDESLYINAHVDYKHRFNGGSDLQYLSKLPGDHGPVYKNENDFIELNDSAEHWVRIVVNDAAGNQSAVNFRIQYSDSLVNKVYSSGLQKFAPGQVNVYEKPEFEVYFPESCLYDTVNAYYYRAEAKTSNAVSASHQLNDASIPLHDDITVRIKLMQDIPDAWKDKLIIKRSSGNNNVRKADWNPDSNRDGWAIAKFNDMGSFQAFVDLQPPEINDPGKPGKEDTIDMSPSKSIVFWPTDNFGGIKNFRAELDGKWERFTNDKGRAWVYSFAEDFPYGEHHLKVSVEDLVGNVSTKEWWFKKYPYTPPKKKVIKKKSSKKKGKK